MAFTLTTQKCSVRRTRLRRVQQLVNELVQLNESVDRQRIALLAAGLSDAETKETLDKTLAAAGPPYITAATDIACHADCDTLTAEIIDLLSTGTNGVGWVYLAE